MQIRLVMKNTSHRCDINRHTPRHRHEYTKGGFPLGEMNGDFVAKFIWACTFLFVYSLAGEIFLFKIVKTDLTNSRRKNLPQLLDQSKQINFNLCFISKYISIRSN